MSPYREPGRRIEQPLIYVPPGMGLPRLPPPVPVPEDSLVFLRFAGWAFVALCGLLVLACPILLLPMAFCWRAIISYMIWLVRL